MRTCSNSAHGFIHRSITNFCFTDREKRKKKSRTNVSRSKRYFFFFFYDWPGCHPWLSIAFMCRDIFFSFLMYVCVYVCMCMWRDVSCKRLKSIQIPPLLLLLNFRSGDPDRAARAECASECEFFASRYELKTLDRNCLAILYFIIDVILLTPRVHPSDVLNRWLLLWWWWWWCNNNVYSDVLEKRAWLLCMYV